MRKEIHGRQPFQAVARLEAVRVPGQGGRVAGYIEDSLGPQRQQAVQNPRGETGARRVGQYRVPAGTALLTPQPVQQGRRIARFVAAPGQSAAFRVAPQ